eukprot:CAMPEP_0115602714 /NCGR_PEP_ID=MMETSP0272-20121206/16054_1 /TAXON_ID=71861 /ORGANISM="Scrippsiella trochoidea, Strain CCMP3099" /LENGTH=710 /DNA_ID=CAMNT_0003038213 /DNA_START=33 /DNA_END=2164 /DNA_ORIENTATION=-
MAPSGADRAELLRELRPVVASVVQKGIYQLQHDITQELEERIEKLYGQSASPWRSMSAGPSFATTPVDNSQEWSGRAGTLRRFATGHLQEEMELITRPLGDAAPMSAKSSRKGKPRLRQRQGLTSKAATWSSLGSGAAAAADDQISALRMAADAAVGAVVNGGSGTTDEPSARAPGGRILPGMVETGSALNLSTAEAAAELAMHQQQVPPPCTKVVSETVTIRQRTVSDDQRSRAETEGSSKTPTHDSEHPSSQGGRSYYSMNSTMQKESSVFFSYNRERWGDLTDSHKLPRLNKTSMTQSTWMRSHKWLSTIRTHALILVEMSTFGSGVCFLLILNAILLGVRVDIEEGGRSAVPAALTICETLLCVTFVLEVALRVIAYGRAFFSMRGWKWNTVDISLIVLQVLEETLSNAFEDEQDAFVNNNYSAVRIIRMLGFLVRILRHISELRTLVLSIMNSVKALTWTLIILFLIIYMFSLYLTQLVSDHLQKPNVGVYADELGNYYGSMGATMLYLFMAITGGVDWADLCTPLLYEFGSLMAFAFSLYIAFSLLAMLNVATGVFVDSVLKSQQADRDLFMVNNARELFQGLEGGINSSMSWEVFQSKLECPQMNEFFKAIDVDPSDAQSIFDLLDWDASGAVTAEEFLNAALRLRGNARSLDVALLMRELRRISREFHHRHAHDVSRKITARSHDVSRKITARSHDVSRKIT